MKKRLEAVVLDGVVKLLDEVADALPRNELRQRVVAMVDNLNAHLQQTKAELSRRALKAVATKRERGIDLAPPPETLVAARQAAADRYNAKSEELRGIIAQLVREHPEANGFKLAEILNERGVRTSQGKEWTHHNVYRYVREARGEDRGMGTDLT